MMSGWAMKADDSDDDLPAAAGRGGGKNKRRKSVELRCGELVPPVGVLHYAADKVCLFGKPISPSLPPSLPPSLLPFNPSTHSPSLPPSLFLPPTERERLRRCLVHGRSQCYQHPPLGKQGGREGGRECCNRPAKIPSILTPYSFLPPSLPQALASLFSPTLSSGPPGLSTTNRASARFSASIPPSSLPPSSSRPPSSSINRRPVSKKMKQPSNPKDWPCCTEEALKERPYR